MMKLRQNRIIAILAISVALGIATSASDVIASSLVQPDYLRALSMLLNTGTIWATLAFFSARMTSKPALGILMGFASISTAVVAYYLYGFLFGDRVGLSITSLTGTAAWWLMLAVAVGPVLGLIGFLSRKKSYVGMLASACLAIGATLEMVVIRRLGVESFKIDPWLAFTQCGIIIGAFILSTVLIAKSVKEPRATAQ